MELICLIVKLRFCFDPFNPRSGSNFACSPYDIFPGLLSKKKMGNNKALGLGEPKLKQRPKLQISLMQDAEKQTVLNEKYCCRAFI